MLLDLFLQVTVFVALIYLDFLRAEDSRLIFFHASFTLLKLVNVYLCNVSDISVDINKGGVHFLSSKFPSSTYIYLFNSKFNEVILCSG